MIRCGEPLAARLATGRSPLRSRSHGPRINAGDTSLLRLLRRDEDGIILIKAQAGRQVRRALRGIIRSLVGGCITHMFSRPREGAQFHPAGVIFSILGAILVLFICQKLKIHPAAL